MAVAMNSGRVRFEAGRLEGASAALSLTDSAGAVSQFRVGESGKLQWWHQGKCKAKAVKTLVWADPDQLSLVSGRGSTLFQANVVDPAPGPELDAFRQALERLAAGAGAAVCCEADRPVPAKSKGRDKSDERRELDGLLRQIGPPGGRAADWLCWPVPELGAGDLLARMGSNQHGGGRGPGDAGLIRWAELPAPLSMVSPEFHQLSGSQPSADPAKDEQRFARKQRQCDAFAMAVAALDLPDGTVVVDFGCGSCGLTLPLAWAFPRLQFVGVDLKPQSLELMRQRAAAAGLTNLRAVCQSISAFDEPFGLALALHACGQASDEAVLQAVARRAAYLVAPCCIGKVKFSYTSEAARQRAWKSRRRYRAGPERRRWGDGEEIGFINRVQLQAEGSWARLRYPRSRWLQAALEPLGEAGAEEVYAGIAASADTNCHGCAECGEEPSGPAGEDCVHHRMCAVVVGTDRNAFAAEEAGYETELVVMPNCATGKSDMLIGWCAS